jgi:hypothetical protein
MISGLEVKKATSSLGSTPVVRAVVYASATGAALALCWLGCWGVLWVGEGWLVGVVVGDGMQCIHIHTLR